MTKIKKLVLNASLCLFPALGVGQTLDRSAILKPLSENWPTYSGDYSGMRDSRLTQIDQSNVKYLALAWTTRVTGGGGRDGHTLWQLLLEDQGRDAHRQSRNPEPGETRGQNPGTDGTFPGSGNIAKTDNVPSVPGFYTGICGEAHRNDVRAGGLPGIRRARTRSAQEPDAVFAHDMDAGARAAARHDPRHHADEVRLPLAGHRRGAGPIRRLRVCGLQQGQRRSAG